MHGHVNKSLCSPGYRNSMLPVLDVSTKITWKLRGRCSFVALIRLNSARTAIGTLTLQAWWWCLYSEGKRCIKNKEKSKNQKNKEEKTRIERLDREFQKHPTAVIIVKNSLNTAFRFNILSYWTHQSLITCPKSLYRAQSFDIWKSAEVTYPMFSPTHKTQASVRETIIIDTLKAWLNSLSNHFHSKQTA